MTAETIAIEYQVKNVGAFIKSTKDAEKALRDEAKALDLSALELQKRIIELKKSGQASQAQIRALQLEAQAARLNSAELKNQAAALAQQTKAAQQSLKPAEDLTKAFTSQTTAALGATVAIAGLGLGISKAITEFGNFERTLNTIKAVSQATAGELDAIKRSSLELGASTIFSNQQVADSYLELARAGFTTKESLAAMPGLLNLAAAAGGDLGESAAITAGILRGFNLNASEAGRVADVLAQSANISAGEISDFGAALKQLAPVALSSNQELEDLAGLLAVLSNRMINGADAGTDLKAILLRLVRPETQKELKALGLQITDNEKRIKPLVQIIGEFQKKFKDLNQAGQLEVAGKIAGIENVKSLLALINTDRGELEEFINKMKQADGAAIEMAETINQGVNTSLEQFGGAIETLASKLGEKLAPAFVAVVDTATDLFSALANNDGLQSFAIGAAAAVTGAASLAATLKLLPAAFQATQAASLALSATLGISTGGLTWVIGGLIAAGGALGVMYQQQAEHEKRLAQTTLELRGEIDSLTESQAQESLKAVKLAKEYDELSKKKNLTKGESQRLADIAEHLVTTMGIEGESVEELTKKYGSLAAAIREKTVASLAEQRQEKLKSELQETQALRKQAGLDLRTAQQAENDFFRPIYGPDGKLLTGKARSKSLQGQTSDAQKNRERLLAQEEKLKNSLETVIDDTRKIYEAAANPPKNAAPSNFGTQNAPIPPKKPPRGPSQDTIERRRVSDILRAQSAFSAGQDADFALRRANLGPEPTQAKLAALEVERLNKAEEQLLKTETALDNLNQKTEGGIEARKTALANVAAEITKTQAATKELSNETERFNKEMRNRERDFIQSLNVGSTEAEFDQLSQNIQQKQDELKTLYDKGLVTAEEYYGELAYMSKYQADAEIKYLEIRKASIGAQIEALTPLEIEEKKHLELLKQKADLQNQIDVKLKQQQTHQEQLNQQLTQSLEQSGKRLGDSFEQQLSSALQSAFQDGGVLGAVKQFAKAFSGSVVKELTDGLAKNIKNALEPFFQALGQVFNKLSGKQSSSSTPGLNNPGAVGTGTVGLTTGKAVIASLGIALAAGGASVSRNSKGAGGKIAGAAMGALGGAATGAMLGSVVPGIGTAIGAVAGAIIGGASSLFGGGGSKKRQEETARNEEKVNKFVNNLLSGADQNNILDLQNRQASLYAQWSKMERSGKTGKQGLLDAANQLQQAIAARQKSISEAIKELKRQNEDLVDQIALNDAKPFETAALERQIALRQITADTQKLLEQFQDSQAARTEILKQESLKRKLLEQQEADAAKATVQDLQDLLSQRDEIANANVFQRAKSAEMLKKESLTNIDRDIAKAYQTLIGQLNAGITPGLTAGLNQILSQVGQLKANGGNATLNVYIDEANDPAMVNEAVTRAFSSFALKVFGANVY